MQEVVLRLRMRLIMVHTQIDEATAREAIERADDARVMSKAWSSWRGTAEVSVAVPAGDPLDAGRLCAFLPMADEAPCPVPGFVNAPFFTAFELRRPRSSTCCAGARRGCTGWSPRSGCWGNSSSRSRSCPRFTRPGTTRRSRASSCGGGPRRRGCSRRRRWLRRASRISSIQGSGRELLPGGGTGVFVPQPMEPSATSTPASTGPSADTAGATAAPVPGRLAAHIRFVHGGMPWFGKRATRHTQGLRWLEQQEFIHACAPQAVLGAAPVPPEDRSVQRPIAVGPTLRGHEDATARHRCTHRWYRGPPAATDRQQRCVDGSYGPLGRLDQASQRHHGTPLRGA